MHFETADDLIASYQAIRRRFFPQPVSIVPVERVRFPTPVRATPKALPPPPPAVIAAAQLVEVDSQRARVKEIAKNVSLRFRIAPAVLYSERRDGVARTARSEWMWLCAQHTTLSYGQLAKACGRQDHTTIIHAVRKEDAKRGTNIGGMRVRPGA